MPILFTCPFLIIFIASIPLNVLLVLLNDFKPIIIIFIFGRANYLAATHSGGRDIQSCNVVFQSKKINSVELSQKICAAIKKCRGFVVKVIILNVNELKNAIASNPFTGIEAEAIALHFFFLSSLPENPDLKTLASVKKDSEQFRLIDKMFYLYAPEGVGRSKLAMKVEKTLEVAVTARNWRTVNKIVEMVK